MEDYFINRRLPELKIQFADMLIKGFWNAIDWVYPPVCAGCGEPGYRLCSNCLATIKFIGKPKCKICGEPVNKEICNKCQKIPPTYTMMRNLALYDGVIRECIHALKYENNAGLGEYFSEFLAGLVIDEGWRVDMVMPVPLSANRQIERGYNQSASIARPLAARLNFQYNPFGLIRTRDTPSQVGLSFEARQMNVSGAFTADPEVVREKRILLVDDVMTTGSTMEACGLALREAGAKEIFCLTVARFSSHMPTSISSRYPV